MPCLYNMAQGKNHLGPGLPLPSRPGGQQTSVHLRLAPIQAHLSGHLPWAHSCLGPAVPGGVLPVSGLLPVLRACPGLPGTGLVVISI